jgi:hypothetical protein
METISKSGNEYRVDFRARDGLVTRGRILIRSDGGEFESFDGEWTPEAVLHVRLIGKAMAAIVKTVAPAFNPKATLEEVNTVARQRRSGRKTPQPGGQGLATKTPTRRKRRGRRR